MTQAKSEMTGAQIVALMIRCGPPVQIGRNIWRFYGWKDDGSNVIFPKQFRDSRRVAEQGPANAV